jgi:hypothetical protein
VTGSSAPRYRRWAQQMLAENALRQVAPAFAAAGLPVVPVKGLALARWIYADTSERGLLDVDLLVPREEIPRVRACVEQADFRLFHASRVFGEVVFSVADVVIEVHSSLGLHDLTGIEVREVLARARTDAETFGFAVSRIDDLDHFTLVAANIVKDHFRKGQAHHRQDLALLWPRVAPRLDELVARLETAGFVTGMYSVAEHMLRRGAPEFAMLRDRLAVRRRRGQAITLAHLRDHETPRLVASAVVAATNDHLATRLRCIARLPLRAHDVLSRKPAPRADLARGSGPGAGGAA